MASIDLAAISRQAPSSHWVDETQNFRNAIHAATISIWSHYANMLFGGDYSRIVYASTDFAFRKRVQQNRSQQLDLPFMNIHLKSIKNSADTRRYWWNHIASVRGIYVPELKRYIRYIPVTLSYDAVVYVHKDIDMHYAVHSLFFDDNNETILNPTFEIDGHIIGSIGIVGYNLNPLEKYNENEFLKENKIITTRLDVQLETYLIQDNFDISIPKKVILDFASKNDLDMEQGYSEIYEGALELIDGNEEMTWNKTSS